MEQLLGSSIAYRIAVGPEQGRNVFTLQRCRPLTGPFDEGPAFVYIRSGERSNHAPLTGASAARVELYALAESTTEKWLPIVDVYRTICIAPSPGVRAVFEAIRELGTAA
jgi:hypothetical protein